jgi:hypothetical protein
MVRQLAASKRLGRLLSLDDLLDGAACIAGFCSSSVQCRTGYAMYVCDMQQHACGDQMHFCSIPCIHTTARVEPCLRRWSLLQRVFTTLTYNA